MNNFEDPYEADTVALFAAEITTLRMRLARTLWACRRIYQIPIRELQIMEMIPELKETFEATDAAFSVYFQELADMGYANEPVAELVARMVRRRNKE